MKIRHPLLIKAAGYLGAWAVRVLVGTVRYRFQALGPQVEPNQEDLRERYIYAFWHENLLLPAYHYGRPEVMVLISQHADGQIMAEACRHLGFSLVRGSSTRGGVEAVRQMLHNGQDRHLAITPDGPRGPRRQVQPGLIYVAARTGLPIVPVGFGFRRAWRMRSWDQFAVPKPFSVATGITLEPIVIPQEIDKDKLEHYRMLVEQGILEATEIAQNWAETGQSSLVISH